MSKETFPIRWRGKTSGPHDIDALRAMLDKGDVSLMHEIFADGRWISLEEFLAQRPKKAPAPVVVVQRPVQPPQPPPRPPGPPPMPPDEFYHVAKHGHAQGPYPKSALKQLVAAGVIGREELAWKQGMPSWKPLHELIELPPAHPPLPVVSGGMPLGAVGLGSHERSSTHNFAAPLAAFAWYQSNEVRKELHQANEELREVNENLEELQDDLGSGDLGSGDSWDFSDI